MIHKLNLFFSTFAFPRQLHGMDKPGTVIDCQGLYSSRCFIGSAPAEQQLLGFFVFLVKSLTPEHLALINTEGSRFVEQDTLKNSALYKQHLV